MVQVSQLYTDLRRVSGADSLISAERHVNQTIYKPYSALITSDNFALKSTV